MCCVSGLKTHRANLLHSPPLPLFLQVGRAATLMGSHCRLSSHLFACLHLRSHRFFSCAVFHTKMRLITLPKPLQQALGVGTGHKSLRLLCLQMPRAEPASHPHQLLSVASVRCRNGPLTEIMSEFKPTPPGMRCLL